MAESPYNGRQTNKRRTNSSLRRKDRKTEKNLSNTPKLPKPPPYLLGVKTEEDSGRREAVMGKYQEIVNKGKFVMRIYVAVFSTDEFLEM